MAIKHGYSPRKGRMAEYTVWQDMKKRTLNPNAKYWNRYGGRGIRVCDRWLNSFPNFLADMGRRPSRLHRIERINNDGNYEPANCKWATMAEQNNNTSRTRNVTMAGKTQTVTQWCQELGICVAMVRQRMHLGWPPIKAITIPRHQRLARSA